MQSVALAGALVRLVTFVALLTVLLPVSVVATKSPAFPLQTKGRWIVGNDGKRVKLACVNWSGADQADGVVGGLQRRHVQDIALTFSSMGFNCVRLPWSVWMVRKNPVVPKDAEDLLLAANPALKGKRTLDVFDAVVDACAKSGLMVMLDNHMSDGDWCCDDYDENGVWYNARWPESEWIAAHVTMAKRYTGHPWVVGTELRNEVRSSIVHGIWRQPGWGGGGPDDWQAAATRAGNAVLEVNKKLLIIVGGLNYARDLSGVYWLPVYLSVPHRVVYSSHCYAWSYPELPNSYEVLKHQLDHDWGFIVEPDRAYTAPVWVSEFGTYSDCQKDSCIAWWPDFLRYLTEGDFDWAVWHGDGTNSRGSSPDHPFNQPTDYGVLSADWQTPANGGELLSALQTVMHPTEGPGVASPGCDDQCADTWVSNWPDGRIGAGACSTCLRNLPCRNFLSIQDWCAQGWAKAACGWTCCRAGLRPADTCVAGQCAAAFADHWQPDWPDQKVDDMACLRCLRDPECRSQKTETTWCGEDFAKDHCSLTCCTAGFIPPPDKQNLCSLAYADHWQPEWADQKVDEMACVHCLTDPTCRGNRSKEEWCADSWAKDHCSLTCCSVGVLPEPPPREQTPLCNAIYADHWQPDWPFQESDEMACMRCLTDLECRSGQSQQEWCSDGWTADHCSLTCCSAGFLKPADKQTFDVCSSAYADQWQPEWPDEKIDDAACVQCLADPACRGQTSQLDWCSDSFAQQHCHMTCCIAALLPPPPPREQNQLCSAAYADHWQPEWPFQEVETMACLRCLTDPACRSQRTEVDWCSGDWSKEHCSLTCCTSGYIQPPDKTTLDACSAAYVDSWLPDWPDGKVDDMACVSCLTDPQCRAGSPEADWCNSNFATTHCRKTCCTTGLIPPPPPREQNLLCTAAYTDHWDPQWPTGEVNGAACELCLLNPDCRNQSSAAEWCHGPWAKGRCPWTCCTAGHTPPPPPREQDPLCSAAYADHWWPDWPGNSAVDDVACLSCLSDPVCRSGRNQVDWCADPWASQHCPLTCCSAGYLPAPSRQGLALCSSAYADSWQPGWDNKKKDEMACVHCLTDPLCRSQRSEAEWCSNPWVNDHCSLTCCTAGYIPPPSKQALDLCSVAYADHWYPEWQNEKVDEMACVQCLKDPACRSARSEEEWCNDIWAQDHCQLTCCTAGFLPPPSTQALDQCRTLYMDDWTPGWPNQKVNKLACVHCLTDATCRTGFSDVGWCGASWAKEHCPLTCCTAGYSPIMVLSRQNLFL